MLWPLKPWLKLMQHHTTILSSDFIEKVVENKANRDAQSWRLTHLTVHLTFHLTCQNRTNSRQPFYFSFGACSEPLHSTADCHFHATSLLSMSVLVVGGNELEYFVNFQNFDSQFFPYILDCLPWHCPRC